MGKISKRTKEKKIYCWTEKKKYIGHNPQHIGERAKVTHDFEYFLTNSSHPENQ
jgi:hypothetical protein